MGFDLIETRRMNEARRVASELADLSTQELSQIVRESHEAQRSDPERFDRIYVNPTIVDGMFKGRRLPTEEGYKVMAATDILTEREGIEYVLGLFNRRMPQGLGEKMRYWLTGEYPSM